MYICKVVTSHRKTQLMQSNVLIITVGLSLDRFFQSALVQVSDCAFRCVWMWQSINHYSTLQLSAPIAWTSISMVPDGSLQNTRHWQCPRLWHKIMSYYHFYTGQKPRYMCRPVQWNTGHLTTLSISKQQSRWLPPWPLLSLLKLVHFEAEAMHSKIES